jgi:long-chain acyl-CoA synthetase
MAEQFASLVELLDKSTRKFAHKPLFGTKTGGAWRWITYDQFRKDVDRFRASLAQLGVARGDRVAIVANNSVEWAIAAYAAYGRGAAFVPMYEAQHVEEWEYILRDSGAKVVVGGSRPIYDALRDVASRLSTLAHVIGIALADTDEHSFRSHLVRGGASPVDVVVPAPDGVAGLIYTSGTTGNPKGVTLTHANVCSNVNAVQELFPFADDERSLAFLPWAHAFGQTCELHTLVSLGASMAINDDPAKIIDNLAEVRPTVLYAVPRVFNRIYDGVTKQMADQPAPIRVLFERGLKAAAKKAKGGSLGLVDRASLATADRLIFSKIRARFGGRLKWVISGSAALNTDVAEFINALGIDVYEGYGLTETSPVAATNFFGHRKIGSVGKALPGVRIDIDTGVTGDPKIGEIVVHGPNVMRGYHNLPEETSKVLTADGGLRTGDLGYVDADGYLFISGRIKEQYKLENGKYVAPGPLEEAIKLSPYISNVMVHGANKPYNVAVVTLDPEAIKKWADAEGRTLADPTHDAGVEKLIKGEIEQRTLAFKAFEKPRKLVIADEDFTTENGMLTPTLKLKRRKVLDRWGAALEKLYESR